MNGTFEYVRAEDVTAAVALTGAAALHHAAARAQPT